MSPSRPFARLRHRAIAPLVAALLCAPSLPASAIDSSLTYQGHLTDSTLSGPATGSYDLQFTLQDTGGATIGTPILVDNASVVGGVFTVELDFGPTAFSGADRFLQIGVRRGSEAGAFTTLTPRSEVRPTPYAQTSAAAEFAASVADNSITTAKIATGAVGATDIDSAVVQRRITGVCPDGEAIQTVTHSGTVTCEAGLQGPAGTPGADGQQGIQGIPGSADAWGRLGNAGTNPATNFIGTTDAQAFEIRTRNSRHLRIEPSTILLNGEPITANVIAGSSANAVDAGARGATIAGGGALTNSDPNVNYANPNRVTDAYGSIGGGIGNRAGNASGTTFDTPFATVGGGRFNNASNSYSTVGGGLGNNAIASESAVGGGNNNSASGQWSTVGGGYHNTASGVNSSVGGGSNNCAGGDYSWAGGRRALVRIGTTQPQDSAGGACRNVDDSGDVDGDDGSFVWADNQDADFQSTGSNQFNIRALGGVNLSPTTNLHFGFNTRQMLNLYGTDYGIGVQSSTMYFRGNNQFAWYRGGIHSDSAVDAGGGALLMTLDAAADPDLPNPTGTLGVQNTTTVSDRNAKTDIEPIDTIDVLARVLDLPLSEWSYKNALLERHLGPMAQDFHAAFGLGGSDKSISTVDADGVALAAIQGLNAKLEVENAAQDAKLAAQASELAEMRRELAMLREDIAALRRLPPTRR